MICLLFEHSWPATTLPWSECAALRPPWLFIALLTFWTRFWIHISSEKHGFLPSVWSMAQADLPRYVFRLAYELAKQLGGFFEGGSPGKAWATAIFFCLQTPTPSQRLRSGKDTLCEKFFNLVLRLRLSEMWQWYHYSRDSCCKNDNDGSRIRWDLAKRQVHGSDAWHSHGAVMSFVWVCLLTSSELKSC